MSAVAIAKEIDNDPDSYVTELADVPSEYLKIIFTKLTYSALSKFLVNDKYKVIYAKYSFCKTCRKLSTLKS